MSKNSISTIDIKRLLISHGIFTAGRVFFEIFLNVLIWKQTGDFVLLAWFNIAYLLMHNITFHLFAVVVKKGEIHLPRKLALLGFTLTYLSIFLMKGNIINYVIPIGLVIGFFNGMYWISYQILRFDLTTGENRGNYTGFEFGIGILVDIIMPVLGGFIVVANFWGNGYPNLFLFGTIFFLISLVVGNVKFPIYSVPHFHFKKTFFLMFKDKNIMKSMWGYTLGSFGRSGALVKLILPLIIFNALQNELKFSVWLSFFSIVAIVGSYAFGKFIDYKHYNTSLFLGGISYFLLIIMVLIFPYFAVFIVFGALIKITTLMINIPRSVISENLIRYIPDSSHHRIEYIVMREWFSIGFGRVFSFVILFMVVGLESFQMKIVLFIIAIVALAEMFFIKSVKWRN